MWRYQGEEPFFLSAHALMDKLATWLPQSQHLYTVFLRGFLEIKYTSSGNAVYIFSQALYLGQVSTTVSCWCDKWSKQKYIRGLKPTIVSSLL